MSPSTPRPTRRRRRRSPVLLLEVNRQGQRVSLTIAAPLLIALLAGVGALLYFFGVARERPPEPAPTADAAAAPAPAPTPQPESATVAWNLASRPAGARVELAGASAELTAALAPQLAARVTPLRLDVPRSDHARLTLVFTRDGHLPARITLAADLEQDVDVQLSPAERVEPVPEASSTGEADPTAADAPAPTDAPLGSPAALQRLIARACGSTMFHYTLKVQWTAGDDGRLVASSVKPLEPRAGLNAEHSFALRQIKRSRLAWPPGKTHVHVFDIGG